MAFNNFQKRQPQLKNKINHQIQANEVRLVSMPEGYTDGLYSTRDALDISYKLGLDLIQVSADNISPAICKIMELSKFLYDQKQKEKSNRKGQKGGEVKEIWLSQNIGDHDLETKAKKTKEFLEEGNKVKVALKFKGRGIMFKEQGELVVLKFADILKDVGVLEYMPKLEGKNMHSMMKAVKK